MNACPLELPMKKLSDPSSAIKHGGCCNLNISSLPTRSEALCSGDALPKFVVSEALRGDEGVCACIFESISIFSSFPSNRSFSSRISHSRILTLSSSDSVYPLGNALLLSLSDVLHSNPTVEHWEQVGVSPSHRIFLLRQRSQAWAMRA